MNLHYGLLLSSVVSGGPVALVCLWGSRLSPVSEVQELFSISEVQLGYFKAALVVLALLYVRLVKITTSFKSQKISHPRSDYHIFTTVKYVSGIQEICFIWSI